MGTVVLGICLLSLAAAAFFGNAQPLAQAAVNGAGEAVRLVLLLTGGLCFWSGVMRLAQKAGLCTLLSKLLSPLLRRLFPLLKKGDRAAELISMNLSANLLGLGNAATPFGLAAMRELQKQNPTPPRAPDAQVTFAVLNSASLQLLPTTLCVLRAAHGCKNPLNILPAVLCTSALSLAVGLFADRMFRALSGRKRK